MQPPQPTMLWESVDPQVALAKRFHFATPAAAVEWLSDTVAGTYGITVTAVDRLTLSAANLIAWLTTEAGPLLAKGSVFAPAYPHLQAAAELVVWLGQASLPVSAPLATPDGLVQVIRDHLALSVQRVMPGDLLEPAQLAQAEGAGVTLAQLHQALVSYPHAGDFAQQRPAPTLPMLIEAWPSPKMAANPEPRFRAGCRALQQRLTQLAPPPLATQLVHGDYRAANLLWHERKISAVLDFEEVHWGYRVNDLAWAAVHLGTRYHNWGPVAPEVHQTFLHSYGAAHPLTEPEQQWMPLLLTWHSLALASSAVGLSTYAAAIDTAEYYLRLLDSHA
ncbi:MAG: phosphotransferase [Caldilineaceae bacterium]